MILLIFSFAACAPGSLGLTNGATPASSTDGSDPESTNYVPASPIVIITPSGLVDTSRVLSFNNDSEAQNPLIGSAGAITSADTSIMFH